MTFLDPGFHETKQEEFDTLARRKYHEKSVGAGQAAPTVGVGSQALPTPSGEYDDYSGESGGLLEGGVRKPEI